MLAPLAEVSVPNATKTPCFLSDLTLSGCLICSQQPANCCGWGVRSPKMGLMLFTTGFEAFAFQLRWPGSAGLGCLPGLLVAQAPLHPLSQGFAWQQEGSLRALEKKDPPEMARLPPEFTLRRCGASPASAHLFLQAVPLGKHRGGHGGPGKHGMQPE